MKLSQSFTTNATKALALLATETKGVMTAVVATVDGFDVASYSDGEIEVQKIAAMASSMGAIGAVVGEESKVGACKSIIIEAETGFVAMVEINHPKYALILTVVAHRSAVLGQLLYSARETAAMLAQLEA